MAAFDFPSSPSVNQTYTANGVTWKWNGTMWMRITGAGYLEKIEEGNSKVEVDDSGSGNITATTDGTERLRITSDGKTGVGVASPLNRFHVYGANTIARFQSSSSYVDVMFQNTGSTNGFIQYNNSGDFRFYANSGSTSTLDITAGSPGNVLCKGKLSVGDLTNPGALLSIPAGESNTPRLAIESAVDDNDFTITQYEDSNGTYTMLGQNVKLNSSGNNTILDSGHRTAAIQLDARNHGSVTFYTGVVNGVTERLRIDSGGRLGLGVVPEAFHSNNKAVIRGDSGYAILGRGDNALNISQNFYYDSSDAGKYIANGEASVYQQLDGQHIFYSAVSGSANAGASLVEKLRITAAGDMGLGTATPTSFGPTFQISGADPALLLQDTATAVDYYGMNIGNGHVTSWFDDSAYFAIGTASGISGASYSERLRITSDGDLESGNITVSSYCNTHSPSNYSVFLADNHANTFFGQNLKLDYNGANNSGNHQLRVMNQHAQIGGAGMLIGGNGSSYVNELNFYTVGANQPVNTRVDDTNRRLTIRSNGDITIRGTNSQYVEAAAFELTQASTTAIVSNNGGFVSFNSLRNTNSTIISHNPNSNSGRRITFPVAGAVHFSMYQDIVVSGTSGYTQARLYKNGTADRYALITYTNSQWDSIVMNTVVEVAANDYLEVYYTGGTIAALDYYNWCSYNFVFYPINTNRG